MAFPRYLEFKRCQNKAKPAVKTRSKMTIKEKAVNDIAVTANCVRRALVMHTRVSNSKRIKMTIDPCFPNDTGFYIYLPKNDVAHAVACSVPRYSSSNWNGHIKPTCLETRLHDHDGKYMCDSDDLLGQGYYHSGIQTFDGEFGDDELIEHLLTLAQACREYHV
jgi:hypothetical protein